MSRPLDSRISASTLLPAPLIKFISWRQKVSLTRSNQRPIIEVAKDGILWEMRALNRSGSDNRRGTRWHLLPGVWTYRGALPMAVRKRSEGVNKLEDGLSGSRGPRA